MKIWVIGKNGQLGQCFLRVLGLEDVVSTGRKDVDISDKFQVQEFLKDKNPDVVINCAAYTEVDKAESDRESCYKVNSFGVKILAQSCRDSGAHLIHFSTDFVFSGDKSIGYEVDDEANPLGVYGESKLQGEREIKKESASATIIRVSWIYSEYSKNFVKTMINLGKTREEVSVVADQIGSPTYAMDLAEFVVNNLDSLLLQRGTNIIHFSNLGEVSWFDFAEQIMKLANLKCKVNPIPSCDYPTAAKRPLYSVLDIAETGNVLDLDVKNWTDSLRRCLNNMFF